GDALVFAPERPTRSPLHTVDAGLLAALLNRAATWVAVDEDEVRDRRLPPDAVRDMLALPDPALPRLEGVVHLPVVRPDGSLALTEGYEPVSKLLQVVDPAVVAAVVDLPHPPSTEDRAAALALL